MDRRPNPKKVTFPDCGINPAGMCMRALPLKIGDWVEFWNEVEAARLRLPREAPEFLAFDWAATRFDSFGVPWWCAYACRSTKGCA
jgi:hypothetical protein